MQGPDPYLVDLGIQLPCAVDPSKPAILDAAHRAFVNYEAYYFSDDDALKAFLAEPYRFTGKVTDPVSMERFAPTADSPRRESGGRIFYFSSGENAGKFDFNPMFRTPMPGMRPIKQTG